LLLNEQQKQLEQNEERLDRPEQAIKLFWNKYNSMHGKANALETDFDKIKYSQVGTNFAISYITTRFLTANNILKDSKRLWGENKLNPALFDYLNFRIPCYGSCLFKYGIAKACKMSHEQTKLYMQFTIPVVDATCGRSI